MSLYVACVGLHIQAAIVSSWPTQMALLLLVLFREKNEADLIGNADHLFVNYLEMSVTNTNKLRPLYKDFRSGVHHPYHVKIKGQNITTTTMFQMVNKIISDLIHGLLK